MNCAMCCFRRQRSFVRSTDCLARLFVCALVVLAGRSSFSAADERERPNIVFVIADDLGWADVAFHGGNVPTPHLDALRAEGLELQQHYVAPVCSPTRTGFMTGRYWSRFGVVNPQNERALPWDTLTVAKALKDAGYETCLTGKWHLGSLPEWGPNHFGFDHSYGSLAGGVSPWNHHYKKGPYTVTWHRDEVLLEEDGHVTDLIAGEATSWIRERKKRPFFLYVPFTAVHLPVKEPQEWINLVPKEITGDVPVHYAASIMHLDGAVGRIRAALKETGDLSNTLFVFTSDNGGSTAENNDLKYPDDNCPNGKLTGNNLPLRGQKGTPYEGGVRVPTIVAWPDRIPSGTTSTPVHIVDWMPTFCELAGCRVPNAARSKWDGVSLVSLLLNNTGPAPRTLYSVAPGWRARTVRSGDWKLIAYGKDKTEKVELFHLSNDPEEKTDQSSSHPDVRERLLRELASISAADNDSVVSKK